MKKNAFIYFLFVTIFNLNAQYTFIFKENKKMVKTLRDEIPDDKVMFVFNYDEPDDLEVVHKDLKDNKCVLTKKNGLVKFTFPHESKVGTIIVKSKYKDLSGKIIYGTHFDEESNFREILPGEIIWVDVQKVKKLKYLIDESNEKSFQIDTQNDAILEINVQPYDLKIDYVEDANIHLAQKKDNEGKYIFYVKPNNNGEVRELKLKVNGYAPVTIKLNQVNPKQYFTYIVKDETYKDGTIIIDSKPTGAKLKLEGVPFWPDNIVTPYPVENIKIGTYTAILSKQGYHTTTKTINIGSQKRIVIPLVEKKAYIDIPLINPEYNGASVFINNKYAGNIPLKNYKVLEGEHIIKITKDNYLSDKISYNVYVKEGQHLIFDKYKLFSVKRVEIISEPSGAQVFIDGNLIHKKTNFKINLTVGEHTIELRKKHYIVSKQRFQVTRFKNKYQFNLIKKEYDIFIDTPYSTKIYVDGDYKGMTPTTLKLPKGTYYVKLKNKSILPKHFLLNVSNSKTVTKKLYPSSTSFLGVSYGIQQVGVDFGLVYNRWYFGIEGRFNIRKDAVKLDEENVITNVNVVDIDSYDKPYGRIYEEGESAMQTSTLKVGYMLAVPFPLIINAGIGLIGNAKHNKVYKAKNDYYDNYGNKVISTGELFSLPDQERDEITAYTFGVILPFSSNFMIKADYFTDSFVGAGFNFGIGFKYDLISK